MQQTRKAPRRIALGIAAQLLACALFGVSYAVVKLGVSGASTFTLLGWRFAFALLALRLAALFKWIRLDLRGKTRKPLLLIGLFQPLLYFPTQTYGISMTTVVESSTILACMPVVTLLLSGGMLRESPRPRQWAGVVLSVSGVVLSSYVRGQGVSLNAVGYLLLLAAMASDSLYVIYTRKAEGYTGIEKTYVSVMLGAIVFNACALSEHALSRTLVEYLTLPFRDTRFLMSALYLAVASQIVAFTLCNFAIDALGASGSSAFVGVASSVGMLSGVVFLKESIGPSRMLGMAMVVLGSWIASRRHAPGKRFAHKARNHKDDR